MPKPKKVPSVAKLITWLLAAIMVTAPLNLFLKWGVEQSYVRGLLVDYLLPKFYLSDIFILTVIGLSGWQFRSWISKRLASLFQTKFALLLAVIGILLAIHQLASPYPLSSIWYFSKLVEISLLMVSLLLWRKYLNLKIIWYALLTSAWLEILISFYQFITQKPLAPYWLLGETRIQTFIGIAQASFGGVQKIIPYGTTAHPNVLAGTLAIYLWLAWLIKDKKRTGIWLATLVPALAILYLTQSVSAWLALGLSFAILLGRSKLPSKIGLAAIISGLVMVPILLVLVLPHYPTNWSLIRRVHLNQTAVNSFVQNPVWGTGLNTSAALNDAYLSPTEVTRFAQPTHHLILNWLAETGVVGAWLAGLLIWKFRAQLDWWLLAGWVPLMALDHYLMSLQTGMILFVLILYWANSTSQN